MTNWVRVNNSFHESCAGSSSSRGATTPFNLRALTLYFLRLGTIGFGGPIALVGHMQKDLVENRRWFSHQDYLQGLAFSQLSPGPLAAQLAIYLGWLHAGVLGGTMTGIAFVLPSFATVMAMAEAYVRFGGLLWIQGAFYGIGAAVVAIIARSAVKLIRTTVGRDWLLWTIFVAMALTTAWKNAEIVWLFLVCGIVAMLWKAPRSCITGRHSYPCRRSCLRPSAEYMVSLPWAHSGQCSCSSRRPERSSLAADLPLFRFFTRG